MGILIMAGQLMLSLSILIVLHEMGHFLPARWFGTRVEKFYLFFDPWFELFKKKIGDTEYGIGWLPLGGYVKISGMIDESFDREQMAQEPQPWEFRSKPAWQRLIIMLGGVTVNFILGFLLYGMVLFVWGQGYLPNEGGKHSIVVDSLGQEMGLADGDRIIAVGDVPFDEFDRRIFFREIAINNARTITVNRDGETINLPVEDRFIKMLTSHENKNFDIFIPRLPFIAKALVKDAPAEKAGVKEGDVIVAYNDTPTPSFYEFYKLSTENKNAPVKVTVEREGSPQPLDFQMTSTDEGTVGIYPEQMDYWFEYRQFTLAQAIPAGINEGWNFLTAQVKAFGQIFKGKIKASESLGGFGSIGKMFGSEWEWKRFWTMTAILSLILAFMNLLPIPALDGGHVMFLLFEVVTGRKPSDKFMEYSTIVGFVIVIGLVLYANGLDIVRAWFN